MKKSKFYISLIEYFNSNSMLNVGDYILTFTDEEIRLITKTYPKQDVLFMHEVFKTLSLNVSGLCATTYDKMCLLSNTFLLINVLLSHY